MAKSVKLKDNTYWDSSGIVIDNKGTTLESVSPTDQYSATSSHAMTGVAVHQAIVDEIPAGVLSNVTQSTAATAVPLVTTAGYIPTKKISKLSVPGGTSIEIENKCSGSTISTLTNYGKITTLNNDTSTEDSGVISTLNNESLISTINNNQPATINQLNNQGTITSLTNDGMGQGVITTLNNTESGTITTLKNNQYCSIGTLNNNGSINYISGTGDLGILDGTQTIAVGSTNTSGVLNTTVYGDNSNCVVYLDGNSTKYRACYINSGSGLNGGCLIIGTDQRISSLTNYGIMGYSDGGGHAESGIYGNNEGDIYLQHKTNNKGNVYVKGYGDNESYQVVSNGAFKKGNWKTKISSSEYGTLSPAYSANRYLHWTEGWSDGSSYMTIGKGFPIKSQNTQTKMSGYYSLFVTTNVGATYSYHTGYQIYAKQDVAGQLVANTAQYIGPEMSICDKDGYIVHFPSMLMIGGLGATNLHANTTIKIEHRSDSSSTREVTEFTYTIAKSCPCVLIYFWSSGYDLTRYEYAVSELN